MSHKSGGIVWRAGRTERFGQIRVGDIWVHPDEKFDSPCQGKNQHRDRRRVRPKTLCPGTDGGESDEELDDNL